MSTKATPGGGRGLAARHDGVDFVDREQLVTAWEQRDAARAELEALTESFADLLRHHTRAVWALKGDVEYPEAERQATARRAETALSRARSAAAMAHSRGSDGA